MCADRADLDSGRPTVRRRGSGAPKVSSRWPRTPTTRHSLRVATLPFDLLTAVALRADDPAAFVDMHQFMTFRRYPPATPEQLCSVEERLGFPVPSLLADLYRSVANGGFGPGYGLMGIAGGASNDQGVTADELYDVFLVADAEAPGGNGAKGCFRSATGGASCTRA